MPTPVSVNVIDTRPRRAGAQLDSERAALRHRLAGVQREIEKGLAQHRRIAVDLERAIAVDRQLDPRALQLGPHDRDHLVEQDRQPHGLQLEILGTRELQESLHDLVEPPDLGRDDVRRAAAPDRRCTLRRDGGHGRCRLAGLIRRRPAVPPPRACSENC